MVEGVVNSWEHHPMHPAPMVSRWMVCSPDRTDKAKVEMVAELVEVEVATPADKVDLCKAAIATVWAGQRVEAWAPRY